MFIVWFIRYIQRPALNLDSHSHPLATLHPGSGGVSTVDHGYSQTSYTGLNAFYPVETKIQNGMYLVKKKPNENNKIELYFF